MQLNTKRTLKFYWKQVCRFKKLGSLALFSMLVVVALDLLIPYYFKIFFDLLSAEKGVAEVGDFVSLLVVIAVLHLGTILFRRIGDFSNVPLQLGVMNNMYEHCFDYLHKHSYRFFTNNFTGSLVKKINRFVRSFELISDKLYYDLLPLFLRVAAIFGILFYIHPVIGGVMFVWTILFLIANYWFIRYKWKFDLDAAKSDTEITGVLADTITNSSNIKLFWGLKFELGQFKKVLRRWKKRVAKVWRLNIIAEAAQGIAMVALEFFILYFAVQLWSEDLLTVGDFVWIQSYLLSLFLRLWDLGRTIRDIFSKLADAEEMIVVLHEEHEVADASKAKDLKISGGKVEFKDVSFAYTGTDSVIKGMSLKIKSGEKVALIGPSGGGKSTVTKILMRFFDLQRGQILIDGQDISNVNQDSLRSNIGFVPQDPILFHRTLMDNIRYGNRDASDKAVIAAAKLAHCHEFIQKFPKKYETYVGERGVKLSGGERQRVAIARAILANTPILVLDEATSALDSESELLIQEALQNLMKNKTTLVIAHRLSTIMRMDRILVIQDGEIAEEGTHGDLLSAKSGLYKKLWDLQVGGYVNQ